MPQETVNFERWRFIGGSDISIIMNLSPFKTRWELLKEKAQLEEPPEFKSRYTEYGNIMEPKIREFINDYYDFDFQEGKHYGDGIRIHTDGEDIMKDTILEIKTTSHIKEDLDDYKIYLVQLLFYMNETKMSNGMLAVYERPEDLNEEFDSAKLTTYMITLGEYQDLIKEIYEEIDLFRKDLAKLKLNPFMSEEELLPNDTRILAHRIIELKELEARINAVKEEREILEKKLGECFEEEKRKTAEIGGYKVTFTPAKGASYKPVETADIEGLKASEFYEQIKSYIKTEVKETKGRKASFTFTRLKE